MRTFGLYTWTYLFIINYSTATNSVTRVLGGSDASENLSPYQASLQSLEGYHVCGGAIVSRRAILTAAHCLLGVLPEYVRIFVGTNDLRLQGDIYNVTSLVVHKRYNDTSRENDIAIVVPEEDIIFKSNVQRIGLNTRFVGGNENLLLTGFGALQPNGQPSVILQALPLKILDLDTCRYAFRNTRYVFDSMMCTFTQIGQGTCHGDSGGPLVVNDSLVGLVSWGIPCAVGFPDVHTRIAHFLDWLAENGVEL